MTSHLAAYVAGTFDTKARELGFLADCLTRLGIRTVTVDLSTTGGPSVAMVGAREVAAHHQSGVAAVFTGDRGSAVTAMAAAFERFVETRTDIGGIISAGGSRQCLARHAGHAAPADRPAQGDGDDDRLGRRRAYVGPSDICMIYPVTDISGINRISAKVLANAAHALAGMMLNQRQPADEEDKPAIGLTMFGVTTPCVQAVQSRLEERFDCLVFHATGTGGQSFEKLAQSGLFAGVLDITTTEIADLLCGGILSAGEDRLGAFSAPACPMSARSARSTWSISDLWTRCRNAIAAATSSPQSAGDADAHHAARNTTASAAGSASA